MPSRCPITRFRALLGLEASSGHDTPDAQPLTLLLRDTTKDQHTRAEKHPIQAALVGARASIAQYAQWLSQMHHVHAALDRALASAPAHAPLASLARPHHQRADRAAEDLTNLLPPQPLSAPLPATRQLVACIEAWSDASPHDPGAAGSLLGVFYVLEGATNGGTFIAKAVRRNIAMVDGRGCDFLDPHGAMVRERWAQWKAGVDALPLSAAQRQAAIDAAKGTFDAITRILDDIARVTPIAHQPVA